MRAFCVMVTTRKQTKPPTSAHNERCIHRARHPPLPSTWHMKSSQPYTCFPLVTGCHHGWLHQSVLVHFMWGINSAFYIHVSQASIDLHYTALKGHFRWPMCKLNMPERRKRYDLCSNLSLPAFPAAEPESPFKTVPTTILGDIR